MNRYKAVAAICSTVMFAVTLLWAAGILAQAVPPTPTPTAPDVWTWIQTNWGLISAAIVALGTLWAAWTGKIKITAPGPSPVVPPVVPPIIPILPGTPAPTIISLLPALIQLLLPLLTKARQEGRKSEAEALQGVMDNAIQAASEPPKQ